MRLASSFVENDERFAVADVAHVEDVAGLTAASASEIAALGRQNGETK